MPKKIAYITDLHLDEPFPIKHGTDARKNWNTILNDVTSRDIKHIVFGGDAGEIDTHEWFFKSLQHFELDMVLGNHDEYDEVIKYYSHTFQKGNPEMYYAYEDTFLKYIFLDSSSNAISDSQFTWLKQQLVTSKPILLFIHHPILKVVTPVDESYPLDRRDRIKQLLLGCKQKVTMVCGHYHMDDEQIDHNIHQLVTPAASYQIVKDVNPIQVQSNGFGYRILTINNDTVDSELILF